MDEYFDFLHIGFMGFAAKPLGVLIALAESFIGAALISGVWRKITAALAMGFQAFFTLLTLALVILNPVMDCGCFGEAIHLTHTQTFIKNLIICTLLSAAFIPFRGFGRPKARKYVSFGIVGTAVIAFAVYSWLFIPPVDFTKFKTGAKLAAGDAVSEDLYDAYFIYEKDGIQEKFTLENLPDSTWAFVSAESVLKEGATAPVVLSFKNSDGEYRDELAAEGKVMVISVYDMDSAENKWDKISSFDSYESNAGFRPLILVAASPEEVEGKIPAELMGHVYYSDFKTLVTLNRSNAGATYFSDGTLICKWACRSLPDKGKLEELFHENKLEQALDKETKGSLGFQGFLLYVFAVMLLL